MSDLVIKTHGFEVAKQGLKEFSEQTTTDLDLRKVDTSKGVGEWIGEWLKGSGIGTDHKVTGEELNSLTSQIQKHLIDINNLHRRLINEFGQVYNALEALDKDYIQAILISIKATERTSESIQVTQEQIKKIVEDQKKTLEVLKKFKQKIDGYSHLGDIDKIWKDCQKWHEENTVLSKSLDNAIYCSQTNESNIKDLGMKLSDVENKTTELALHLAQLKEANDTIVSFTKKLEEFIHLQDVDEMWESLKKAHDSLESISETINYIKDTASQHQSDIENLIAYKKKLSGYKHLDDVDSIWTKSEEHSLRLDELNKTCERVQSEALSNAKNIEELKRYKAHLSDIEHLDDIDKLWEKVESHTIKSEELEQQDEKILKLSKENIDAAIAQVVEKNETTIQTLTKKIKYAYLIAGGALGIAIIEIIIILLKVM